MRSSLKICLAASAGGHLSQLLKLAESWKRYETFYITTAEVMRQKLRQHGKVYVVGECNHRHPWQVARVFVRCLRIVFIERPDIVISTGAAAGCIACFLAKLFKAKVIWVDSITNVKKISLSGRMVHYIASLFFVQWPHLVQKHKDVEYVGEVT